MPFQDEKNPRWEMNDAFFSDAAMASSSLNRRSWLRWLSKMCLLGGTLGMPGLASAWKISRINGRDYVTSDDMFTFYRFEKKVREGKSLYLRTSNLVLKATSGSQEMLINNVKFVLSFPVLESGSALLFSRLDLAKLIDPVLRPQYIRTKQVFDTVVLDPGHGGHDSGAISATQGREKTYSLQLGLLLRQALQKKGLKVHMTRDTDVFLSLGERVAEANRVKNAIFISLHFNSGGAGASGIETFALSPQGSASVYGARSNDAVEFSGNARDSENIALATAVHAYVLHTIRAVDRGIKRARYHVLKGINMPAILFEGGFLTDLEEAKKIANPAHQAVLANSIAQAVENYKSAISKRTKR